MTLQMSADAMVQGGRDWTELRGRPGRVGEAMTVEPLFRRKSDEGNRSSTRPS